MADLTRVLYEGVTRVVPRGDLLVDTELGVVTVSLPASTRLELVHVVHRELAALAPGLRVVLWPVPS